MKKAVISGQRQAKLIDVPDPTPKEDWVVVKVHAAPMCTEYKSFVAGYESDNLGHEAAGEVVAVAQPGHVKVGDRVVVLPQYPCGKCPLCVAGDFVYCEHSYDFEKFVGARDGSATVAQYLLKPSWLLPLIPDGLTYEQASLACCALGPTFGPMDTMRVGPFDTVLITGAGPVGLGGVVNAKFRGAKVIVVESHPYRVDRAKRLGADLVLDPDREDLLAQIKEFTNGLGVDKAVECAGYVPAQRLCLDATRRRGSVAFVGECYDAQLQLTISPDLLRTGLTVYGSWYYNRGLFPQIMEVIQRSPSIPDLVSHVLPMSQIQRALELSASRDCAKIILKPWE
jgi:threonine dehydrogenase-like Zn-dependent dehydrogenase